MKENRKAYASMISAMLIFGTVAIFRRFIPLSSALLAFFRGIIGALVLLLYTALRGRRLQKPAKGQLALLMLTGGLLGANWIVLFESYNYTTVATATMCFYMQPTIMILLSPLVFRERLTARKLLCALAAIVGMLFVSGAAEAGAGGVDDGRGIALGLCAAMLYALIVMLNKKVKNEDAYVNTILQLAAAAAVLIPYLLLTEDFSAVQLDMRTVVPVLLLGAVHTGFAYALYFGSVKALKAQSIAVLGYIDPVSTLFLSALVLHERLSALGILGAVLILGSAFVSEIEKKKE